MSTYITDSRSIKIIYITDLHEANKELRYLFQKELADLFLISGDLIYRSFFSDDILYEYITLQEEFWHHIDQNNIKATPFQLSEKLLQNSHDDIWKKKADKYLHLYEKASRNMKAKYVILEEIFRKYCSVPVYVIPGNYDMDLDKTVLQYRNIHKKSVFFNGYKISGFGGADIKTFGIPEHLVVQYREMDPQTNTSSEAYDFFKKENSNIILIHKPIYGYFDRVSGYGNTGSVALAQLSEEENNLCLILSGHIHHDRGFKRKEKILVHNPGNFGRTIQVSGMSDGGFFSTIILDANPSDNGIKNCLRQIKWQGISRGKICLIEDSIFPPPQGVFGKFGLYEEIKSYFRQYETTDTKIRVKDFINIARAIQSNGESIAFDILGSVNFGMSHNISDVDLIMYHMCPKHWVCDMNLCYKSRHYKNLILQTLLHEISEIKYPLHVLDCINIRNVLQALDESDSLSESLIRYTFYRKIGRSINKRFLLMIDRMIATKPKLKTKVNEVVAELMKSISEASTSYESMNKYRSRLAEMGISLPSSINAKIFQYLGQK